jgi:hypothetical protein
VLRVRPIRAQLHGEQVVERPTGRRAVTDRDLRGGQLVKVARPDRMLARSTATETERESEGGVRADRDLRGLNQISGRIRPAVLRGEPMVRDKILEVVARGAGISVGIRPTRMRWRTDRHR